MFIDHPVPCDLYKLYTTYSGSVIIEVLNEFIPVYSPAESPTHERADLFWCVIQLRIISKNHYELDKR